VAVVAGQDLPKPKPAGAVRRGAGAGVKAGLLFLLVVLVVTAAESGFGAALMHIRMMAVLWLGPEAFAPDYPFLVTLIAAAVVHLLLSLFYGVLFAPFAAASNALPWAVGIGGFYGFAVWYFHYSALAPAAAPWFLEANLPLLAGIHVVFFGAALGWFSWRARQRAIAEAS
jgi:hypothetical protein